jgi:hypothetical protein
MRPRIVHGLTPVRRRQRAQVVLWAAALGLLASSVVGIGLGAWKLVMGRPVALPVALGVLAAGPVLGVLAGALARLRWHEAAVAVDARYRLKDRIASALEFLARGRATASPVHELQIADAEDHLTGVEARAVVPIRVPRALPVAVGTLAVAAALLAWPLAARPVAAGPAAPLPRIVAAANQFGEDLKPLDELARQERDKGLTELVRQIHQKLDEMKQPGVDPREALAKLSEIQAAITAQQAQYNIGLVDGQLQSLGDALVPADALEAAGHALQDAKFDKAAQELETLEDPELERKEAKAVEEKLKQVADAMGDAGLGQMSEAASEMAEGVKGGQKSKFKKGTRTMAQLVKGHGRRRKIKEILDAELEALAESKNECQGDKAVRFRKPEKSKTPSSDWGAGISGNVFGEQTNLASKRDLKEITGNPGDGPSEMETTHSPEGRQVAARRYRETYQKYRRMSEAVLDSEPIPLGHRQTIRKYFELIRPQNGEGATEKTPSPGTSGPPSGSTR